MTRIAPLVGFVRKEAFVRSLVTVQGRYRTRMQRYSVRIYVAFWPLAEVPIVPGRVSFRRKSGHQIEIAQPALFCEWRFAETGGYFVRANPDDRSSARLLLEPVCGVVARC